MNKNIILLSLFFVLISGCIGQPTTTETEQKTELISKIIDDFNSDCENNWTIYVDNLDTPDNEHIEIYNGKLCDFNIFTANMGIPYSHGRVTAIKDFVDINKTSVSYNLSCGRISI